MKRDEMTELEFVKDCLDEISQAHNDRCVGLHNDCYEMQEKAEALVEKWHKASEQLQRTNLRSLIFKAWETTQPCPDGDPFCPSCFFETFFKLLTETSQPND